MSEAGTKPGRVSVARTGAVGRIEFDSPAKMNAMSFAMWQGLHDAIHAFVEEEQIRAVVLSGAGGRSFVSGADISEFESLRASEKHVARYNAMSTGASKALFAFPRPTIAKIQGYCIGGGLGIALSCDIRICSDSSRFAIPAAKLGLAYDFAGLKKLCDVVGPAYASEILFSGRQFTAEEALRIGLVNRVVPEADLDATVDELADRVAGNAPLTIEAAKAAIRGWALPESERDLDALSAMVKRCFASEDYAEGRRAFAEKRKPVFKGR